MFERNKSIAIWLFCCCFVVFMMVAIGGLTRLTESGLSIVEWQPIHGVIPPLNMQDWNDEFESYQQSPEYLKKNLGMSLDEFKNIFWWEYFHRLLGRIIGIVFIIPFIYFTAKKYFPAKKAVQLFLIFSLGGLQGFVGWWMVKSGLIDNPVVSHFRLAIHLSIALLIFSLLFWQGLGFYYSDSKKEKKPKAMFFSNLLIFIIAAQIIFGAFMAGLDAGLTYNSWPLMDGKLIPAGIKLSLSNIELIQFFHRWWAFVVIFVAIYFSRLIRKKKIILDELSFARVRKAQILIHSLIGIQIVIGILTLIYVVPVALASLHQITAVLILTTAVYIRKVI